MTVVLQNNVGEIVEEINPEVNPTIKPQHYQAGAGDVIDFCQRHKVNFARGNVIKYVTRAGKKDPTKELEDLLKAREFLNREIALLEEK